MPKSAYIFILILLVLAVGLFYNPPQRETDGKVILHYWTGWTGEELETQKRIVERFNRTHPNIEVKILSIAGSYQKVRIAFAGGSTPDVCSAIWAT